MICIFITIRLFVSSSVSKQWVGDGLGCLLVWRKSRHSLGNDQDSGPLGGGQKKGIVWCSETTGIWPQSRPRFGGLCSPFFLATEGRLTSGGAFRAFSSRASPRQGPGPALSQPCLLISDRSCWSARQSELDCCSWYSPAGLYRDRLAVHIKGRSVQSRGSLIIMNEEMLEAMHRSGARVKALAVLGVRLCARLKISQRLLNGSLSAHLPKSSPARTY